MNQVKRRCVVVVVAVRLVGRWMSLCGAATVSLSHTNGFYPPFSHYFSIIAKAVYLGYNSNMARTAMIRARPEPDMKSDVEGIFQELGLSATEAINLFYRQVRLKKGLPFDVRMADCDNQAG